MIKLFEQWVAEEDAKIDQTVTPDPVKISTTSTNQNTHKISVKTPEMSFDIIGTADSETSLAKSYTTDSSTNTQVQKGSTVLVSPKADKDGEFDIIIINDQNKPEEALTFSGNVTIG